MASTRPTDGPFGPAGKEEAEGRVRPMTEDDLPEVVGLYERVFRRGAAGSARPVGEYLREILFRNPWRDETLPSLVYEEAPGRIAGSLGVMPRDMILQGRPIRAA